MTDWDGMTIVASMCDDAAMVIAYYDGGRKEIEVLRIDGPDELDWLLTLGAVVRTEDGESVRKINTRF